MLFQAAEVCSIGSWVRPNRRSLDAFQDLVDQSSLMDSSQAFGLLVCLVGFFHTYLFRSLLVVVVTAPSYTLCRCGLSDM